LATGGKVRGGPIPEDFCGGGKRDQGQGSFSYVETPKKKKKKKLMREGKWGDLTRIFTWFILRPPGERNVWNHSQMTNEALFSKGSLRRSFLKNRGQELLVEGEFYNYKLNGPGAL